MITRVLNKKKHRNLKTDDNQVCYLLLHLGVPAKIYPPPSMRYIEGLATAEVEGGKLGIILKPVRLTWPNKRGYFRYIFCFPQYKRDDLRANRIGETILLAVSLVRPLLLTTFDLSPILRLPARTIFNQKSIPIRKLIQIEETRNPSDKVLAYPSTTLNCVNGASGDSIDIAWKIAHTLFENDDLSRAAQFLKASHDLFYTSPDQTRDIIDKPDLMARYCSEQITLESALHNAFKSIEAILGDPPKDDEKFFAKLSLIGLDPNEEIGYFVKVPLHKAIRKMNQARDKKAAHGSTINRQISFAEMLEYQACAELILYSAIESKLGEPVFN